MFIDTRKIDGRSDIEADICIIGGGVAGITLALALDKFGVRTCVLESGGFKPDDQTRDLYRGKSVGIPYLFSDGCRSRYFGGSSNCWGGFCRPMEEHDFYPRDWVPYSGWPFTKATLAPYYERTHELLKLGPFNYDAGFWECAIGRKDVRRLPLEQSCFVDVVSQLSPPARFGMLYRDQLARSENIRVFLYANAIDIEIDRLGQTVTRIKAATLSGNKVFFSAPLFTLAAGGIENARLLLVSNSVQPAGLGNGNDLVGRYFMDHPRVRSGRVRFTKPWAKNKLYDIKFFYQNNTVAAHGTRVGAQFSLRPEIQAQERLLNAQLWFSSIFYGEYTPTAAAIARFKHMLEKKDQPDHKLSRDITTVVTHPWQAAGFVLARVAQPQALIKGVTFQAIVEPEPDPESRVSLSTERDQLGMNRVRVEWRLSELVKRTFDRNFALMADELHRTRVAEVTLDPPLTDTGWPDSFEYEGTWHHMGTTRMHDSPKYGVVDRNCRVHGMTNLYVAGSSIFPTAGANYPTITLTAISLRLAEHLAQELAAIRTDIAA